MDTERAVQDLLNPFRNFLISTENSHTNDKETGVTRKVTKVGPRVAINVLSIINYYQGAIEGVQLSSLDNTTKESLEGFSPTSRGEIG